MGTQELAVDHRDRLAGVVDEELLAGAVLLAHDQILPAPPLAVQIAESAVLVPLGGNCLVLLPQEEQGDALLLQLQVQHRPVRLRS